MPSSKKHEFKIAKGEPRVYRLSHYAERRFRKDCGSSLVVRAIEKDWLSIQKGTLDDPEVAPPSGRYSIEGKISWLAIVDDLPRMRTEADEWQQKHNDNL